MGTVTLQPGRPWPMGAHWDGTGVNFAVFSAHAHAIELCLFEGPHETRIALPGHSGDVWHGRLPGGRPGLVYGLRAHGPWHPEQGHRFNAHHLLLDPYARELVPGPAWRARVVRDDDFDWGGDHAPFTPLSDTVLYELHVKGFTRLHPDVPPAWRGTYAGLASEAATAHLQRLGVTAVSLMPVQQWLDEPRLAARGLTNYWGYNPIGHFAVEPRLASDAAHARHEFRAMVRALHAAGLEVIIDVVFNHTAESDDTGPTLSWRGLDNASYYRLHDGRCDNLTGCGNTLDLRHPRVLQLVMDSLRYWVQCMHVDGFRFDLAPVLARGDRGFDMHAAFFHAVAQDPTLQRVKLIAEPWDLGPGGYRLGEFPRGWLEWNDRYRDTMRTFWLRGTATRGDFAHRLCASADDFHTRHRQPGESVNFVVAHDGFTLRDLVSYEHRHNEANGEGNRDGHAHNHSWHGGVEGETTDAAINALRARLQRALLATLLLSQGTPMLCAGDDIGRTQRGNNNAYCQDNDTSWLHWPSMDEALAVFTARVVALRRELQPLAAHWYSGRARGNGPIDLSWWRPDGTPMQAHDWDTHGPLAALIGEPGKAATPLLLLVNPHADVCLFALPPGRWRARLDSSHPIGASSWQGDAPGPYEASARSVTLLEAVTSSAA